MLHICAEYGHEQLFKFFLNDPGADAMVRNYMDETPLHLAAREGKLNIVQLLVNVMRVEVNADTLVSIDFLLVFLP